MEIKKYRFEEIKYTLDSNVILKWKIQTFLVQWYLFQNLDFKCKLSLPMIFYYLITPWLYPWQFLTKATDKKLCFWVKISLKKFTFLDCKRLNVEVLNFRACFLKGCVQISSEKKLNKDDQKRPNKYTKPKLN